MLLDVDLVIGGHFYAGRSSELVQNVDVSVSNDGSLNGSWQLL